MTPPSSETSSSLPPERTVLVVWPTNAMFVIGRWLGRGYAIRWPVPGYKLFWLGNLVAIASIPIAVVLYLLRVAPFGLGVRYRLTTQRIVVERGLSGKEAESIALDGFDEIAIDVLPGMEWYDSGDLVLRREGTEVFRLAAAPHPETLRHTLEKSHAIFVGIKRTQQTAKP